VGNEHSHRMMIPATKEKDIPGQLKQLAPQLNLTKIAKSKNQKKMWKDVQAFEQTQVANTYKWGVLFMKQGQTEDEMYGNLEGNCSKDFEEFTRFLGDKIVLKDWKNFRGGLDAKSNSTGTHSVYTQFHDMEIMFHVASLLPYNPNDAQNLERKRHHGNDIIVIIFKEGNQPFSPSIMRSELNHIFVVVSIVPKSITGRDGTFYKIEIATKDGVPPYGPPLPYPSIFEKNDSLRELLFTKLINGERASLHGCPNFRNKVISARKILLENLEKEYGKK